MTAPDQNGNDRRHSAMTTNADTPDPMQEAVTAATEALRSLVCHCGNDYSDCIDCGAEAAVTAAAPHIEAEARADERRRVADGLDALGLGNSAAAARRLYAAWDAARIAAGQTEGDDRG